MLNNGFASLFSHGTAQQELRPPFMLQRLADFLYDGYGKDFQYA
jgi:hypothetical protein